MSCAAYVVRRTYAPKLINLWKNTFDYFMKEYDNTGKIIKNFDEISLDVVWIKLQHVDTFLLLVPLGVTQLEGYSDCWERHSNWHKMMLNLGKLPSPLDIPACNNCKVATKHQFILTDEAEQLGIWMCKDCCRDHDGVVVEGTGRHT
jgi:hypothetical protein